MMVVWFVLIICDSHFYWLQREREEKNTNLCAPAINSLGSQNNNCDVNIQQQQRKTSIHIEMSVQCMHFYCSSQLVNFGCVCVAVIVCTPQFCIHSHALAIIIYIVIIIFWLCGYELLVFCSLSLIHCSDKVASTTLAIAIYTNCKGDDDTYLPKHYQQQ